MIGRFLGRSDSLTKSAVLLLMVAVILLMTLRPVFSQPNIEAPVLTRVVTLDGKITNADEWSDTRETYMTLVQDYTSGLLPIERRYTVIWAKHDGTWLYLLVKVARLSADDPNDNCGIIYHRSLGPTGSKGKLSDYKFHDLSGVNMRDAPIDQYGFDGSRWYNDVADGGTNDVEGFATQDNVSQWFEFRKKLDSGDKHDWTLSPGMTYGLDEGIMRIFSNDMKNKRSYTAPVRLSLLSTSLTITKITSVEQPLTITMTTLIERTPVTTGTTFGFLDLSTLQQVGGVAATGAGIAGYHFKTRKRRFVTNYLKKIESTSENESLGSEERKVQLNKMRDEIVRLLEDGKIDESHFTALDGRLTERLRNLD